MRRPVDAESSHTAVREQIQADVRKTACRIGGMKVIMTSLTSARIQRSHRNDRLPLIGPQRIGYRHVFRIRLSADGRRPTGQMIAFYSNEVCRLTKSKRVQFNIPHLLAPRNKLEWSNAEGNCLRSRMYPHRILGWCREFLPITNTLQTTVSDLK